MTESNLPGYERQLEDAVLALWAELPVAEAKRLRAESPALADFCGHLHHRIEHEQAMVRRNVWAEADPSDFDENDHADQGS